MIEGLRIEMTFDELFTRITERINHHKGRAAECEERLRRDEDEPDDTSSDDDDDDDPFPSLRVTSRQVVEQQRDEHCEQVRFLVILRDHLVRGEVYRLGEDDLRVADLTPESTCW